ncbi:hypothetical protein [Qipengyuania nanhaisediminis]|uniref:hypothetical protein n=1 Tax=Qipengyuania nanhaisediminis TaxID=604088 RepID=UPI0038B2CAD6
MTDKPEKPKAPRKRRVDSAASVAAAIVAGGKSIQLPSDIKFTPSEREVFDEVCGEFSKNELSPHKVRMVALMARDMVLLEREQALLKTEGYSITNANGNTIPNPRARTCNSVAASILATRRSLGIHTRAQAGGDNREAAKRRAINQKNEASRGSYDDNLIALPRQETDDDSVH